MRYIPGKLDVKDSPESAMALFGLVNMIVQVMISDRNKSRSYMATFRKAHLRQSRNETVPKSLPEAWRKSGLEALTFGSAADSL